MNIQRYFEKKFFYKEDVSYCKQSLFFSIFKILILNFHVFWVILVNIIAFFHGKGHDKNLAVFRNHFFSLIESLVRSARP